MKRKSKAASASPWRVSCRFNVQRDPNEPVCYWEVYREISRGSAQTEYEYEQPRQRYRTAELARMRADMLNCKVGDGNVRDIRTRQCEVEGSNTK